MAVLPVEVPFALLLNLLLLFCVALEPYLFFILASVDSLDLVNTESIAYALDVGHVPPPCCPSFVGREGRTEDWFRRRSSSPAPSHAAEIQVGDESRDHRWRDIHRLGIADLLDNDSDWVFEIRPLVFLVRNLTCGDPPFGPRKEA